jgi:riboflavin kinase/FMN adenylyltransferase
VNVPAQFEGLEAARLPGRATHLAIGMFDGVHLGHRAVIEPAVRAARQSGGQAVVLTFWPHPSALFRPENPTRLIQEPPAKARVLGSLDVDAVVTQRFTPEFAGIAAEKFLEWVKQKLPSVVAVYVGENFRFGRGRRGDGALLESTGRSLGIEVVRAAHVNFAGEPVSSTRIRAALEAGEIDTANALLGYPYFAEGVVEPGKRLGRTIGFPTLNLAWSPPLRPKLGVYAVRVTGAKTAALSAVANYGLRPTVEQASEPRLEVHVLGECPLGAGDRLTVEWLKFLRPELKFAGLDELRAQIARDREAAAEFFRG